MFVVRGCFLHTTHFLSSICKYRFKIWFLGIPNRSDWKPINPSAPDTICDALQLSGVHSSLTGTSLPFHSKDFEYVSDVICTSGRKLQVHLWLLHTQKILLTIFKTCKDILNAVPVMLIYFNWATSCIV